MLLQAFSPAPLQVPSLVFADAAVSAQIGGVCVEVRAPGEIHGLSLLPGDLLLVDPGAKDGELVVVAPRGRGRPMLALQTAEGAMALPSGVRCTPSRWQVLGRVVLQQRPQPQSMDKVLAFPARAQALLPLTPGSLEGEAMVLRFWGVLSSELVDHVAARFGALKVQGAELHLPRPKGQSLEQLGDFARELGVRFGVRVVAAIADDLASAQSACQVLAPGAVAVVPKGQELPEPGLEKELSLACEMDTVARATQVPQLALF